jgi:hypothetical protein
MENTSMRDPSKLQNELIAEELWKDVVGYEGLYQCSNIGRVRSLDKVIHTNNQHGSCSKWKKGKQLKQYDNQHGYLVAHLHNGKPKTIAVHRIIALAFIPNTDNKSEVNHIDGDKTNNKISNLEWNTRSENQKHAFATGLNKPNDKAGEKNAMSKLTKSQVHRIRTLAEIGYKRSIIADLFNVCWQSIDSIVTRKTWNHI